MIKEAIAKLIKKENLTTEMMEQVMEEIMTGEATDAQKASFLTAMTMKGETIDEITSAAKVMRSHCEKFLNDMDVLEIVGTGGDGANTINISTIASIIVSSTGIPVATVAVDGAANAAILAVEMLALSDDSLAEKLENMKADMEKGVAEKDKAMQAKVAEL